MLEARGHNCRQLRLHKNQVSLSASSGHQQLKAEAPSDGVCINGRGSISNVPEKPSDCDRNHISKLYKIEQYLDGANLSSRSLTEGAQRDMDATYIGGFWPE